MSMTDPDEAPSWGFVPPQVLAVVGQPDPLISAPVPPNIEQRLTANEINTADLSERVSTLETE